MLFVILEQPAERVLWKTSPNTILENYSNLEYGMVDLS